MKKWILKAIVQKTISFLPFKHKINFLFQKYVTKGVYLSDEYFEDRLIHASNHLKGYQKLTGQSFPLKTLELGTGWYPVVPFVFYLCGSNEIHSIDIASLTNKERLITTLKKFETYFNDSNKKNLLYDLPLNKDRISFFFELLKNSEQFTESEILHTLYLKLTIVDASKTNYSSGYFDLVHSNNTFEHVYPNILKNILSEFARITKKNGGVMSHFIDMSDHFAHFDKSITIYNFLQFSKSQWKLIDNSIQPLNRLRLPDYLKMYIELNIPATLIDNRPGNIKEVESLKIDVSFKVYSNADLAISHSYIFSLL